MRVTKKAITIHFDFDEICEILVEKARDMALGYQLEPDFKVEDVTFCSEEGTYQINLD